MARRSDHTREELKEMAISAGHALVSAQGLRNFSARQVAAEIGYTVGTLYNLFGTLDDLILHINARTLDAWYAEWEQRIKARKKPLTLQELSVFYIEYSGTHYNAWMALFEHVTGPETVIPDWYMPKMRRFFDLVEGLVLPYVKNNRKQARRAARVLWAGIHGICTLSLSNKLDLVEAESAQILAKSFVDNYLRGCQD